MEKIVNDYSTELIIWQIFLVVFVLIIVYFLVKLYKKFNNFLNKEKQIYLKEFKKRQEGANMQLLTILDGKCNRGLLQYLAFF